VALYWGRLLVRSTGRLLYEAGDSVLAVYCTALSYPQVIHR